MSRFQIVKKPCRALSVPGLSGSKLFVQLICLAALIAGPVAYAQHNDSERLQPGAKNLLKAGAVLMPGRSIYSPSGYQRLTMQSDGNLVVYTRDRNSGAETAIWATMTHGNGQVRPALVMQKNGNLELVTSDRRKIWESSTIGKSGDYFLAIKDDGTLVIHGDDSLRLIARRIRNGANQMCVSVDHANTANRSNVLLWDCNMGDRSQEFSYNAADQSIRFHKNPNKCLDIDGGSFNSGANIQIFDCNLSNAQRFVYYPQSGQIKSAVSNYCVDIFNGNSSSGTNIQLYACNDSDAQKFDIVRDGSTPIWINQIGFSKRSQPSKCLDVFNGSNAPGTVVQLYDCNGTAAQSFTYNRINGTVSLAAHPGMCLDLKNNATGSDSRIQLWTCGGNNSAQQFDLNFATGRFHWRANPAQCIDINGGNVNNSNHTKIALYPCNDSGAQNFDLTKKIQTFKLGFSDIDDDVHVYVNGTRQLYSGRFSQPFLELDPAWLRTGDNEIAIYLGNSGCWANSLTAVMFKNGIPEPVVDRRHYSATSAHCGWVLEWHYKINTSSGAVSVKGSSTAHDEL